jgi:hypothetical protein
MKNKLFTAILIAGLAFPFLGTNHVYGQAPMGTKTMKDTTMKYSCPHHPNIKSDKPGKCSCGMDLVAIKGKDEMSKSPGKMNNKMMDDSKNMKQVDKKMMNDKMMDDSKNMKQDKKKMMKDSTMMKKR